jgi:hypothetical protein
VRECALFNVVYETAFVRSRSPRREPGAEPDRHGYAAGEDGLHLYWDLFATVGPTVGRAADYRPVPTDGAARAAAMIAELL